MFTAVFIKSRRFYLTEGMTKLPWYDEPLSIYSSFAGMLAFSDVSL